MRNDKIIFIGKPNAGKGTLQKSFLEGRSEEFELLSVGDLLRKARKEQTELGKKAAAYMDAGILVPDELICGLAIPALQSATKPIISDGFPRNVYQAKAMLDAGISPIVIEFYVDDNVARERALNRLICEKCGETYTLNQFHPPLVEGICDKCGSPLGKRSDDNSEVVERRLKEYQEKTLPVINFLACNNIEVHTIDTSSSNAADQLIKLLID